MNIESTFSLIICGMVAGICARFLLPGRLHLSLTTTTLLGIGGALLGGFLYLLIQGGSAQPFSLASQNWYGWIAAVLGATLLVWIYPFVHPKRWWN